MLLLAVWTAWMYTAWITSWFDPSTLPVRLMLVGAMLEPAHVGCDPEAFDDRGLEFAGAFVALQVGRTVWVLVVIGRRHELSANFQRVSTWLLGIGVFWLAGALAKATPASRSGCSPSSSRSRPSGSGSRSRSCRRTDGEWTIAGEHLAERCQLFVIIALGESIITGAGFGELPVAIETTAAAFVVAFVGSVALWWIYFDRGAELAQEIIRRSDDPGRLGRSPIRTSHPDDRGDHRRRGGG